MSSTPMNRDDMIEILEKLISDLQNARVSLEMGQYENALCLMSNVYACGIGQLMDDIKIFRQPTCTHDWYIQSYDKNKVEMKCIKCFMYKTVEVG